MGQEVWGHRGRHCQLLGDGFHGAAQDWPCKDKLGPPQAGQKCPGQELLRPPGVSWRHSSQGRWSQTCHHCPGLEGFGNCPPGPLQCLPVCTSGCWSHCPPVCLHTWLLESFSDSRTELITAPPHQSKPSEKGSQTPLTAWSLILGPSEVSSRNPIASAGPGYHWKEFPSFQMWRVEALRLHEMRNKEF